MYLWTSEEEASYPGYSSATVSEGCRSDRRLKGGVSLSFDLKYKISATLLGTLYTYVTSHECKRLIIQSHGRVSVHLGPGPVNREKLHLCLVFWVIYKSWAVF